jgi:hypothetical protein
LFDITKALLNNYGIVDFTNGSIGHEKYEMQT